MKQNNNNVAEWQGHCRTSGRSKCMCTFSTTFDVPSTRSTSPNILLISLLVVAIYGSATMTLFLLHEANDLSLRYQFAVQEFTCPNDFLKAVYGTAIVMLFLLCGVLLRWVRIMVRFLMLHVRVLLFEFYYRRRQRIQEGCSWCFGSKDEDGRLIQEGCSWCFGSKDEDGRLGGFQPEPVGEDEDEEPPHLIIVGEDEDEDEEPPHLIIVGEDEDEEIVIFD